MASFEEILTDRALRVRRRFEVPVLVAALAVVPVIFIEEQATSSTMVSIASWANWAIWVVFVAEYISVMWLTDQRVAYTKRAWVDVFIIVTSLPALPGLLESTRLLRLARLGRVLRILRLTRLAAVVTRGGMAARAIFRKRGLGYVVVITLLVGMGVGGVFAIVEDSPVGDALWWAIVTMTTVGYGDMFPVTTGGRIAATVLMLLGIGFLAVITATVAAYFVESDEESDFDQVNERLDRLETLLRSLVGEGAGDELGDAPGATEDVSE
jgi:voltage-gated potassium channel